MIFFAGGASICLLIVLALAFPGGSLDSIWRLKPEAPAQFQEIGRGVSIVLMATVGVACGLSAIGLARNAQWGRRLATAVLVVNLIGDSLNALLRHDPKNPDRRADRRIDDLVSRKRQALSVEHSWRSAN